MKYTYKAWVIDPEKPDDDDAVIEVERTVEASSKWRAWYLATKPADVISVHSLKPEHLSD